MIAKVMIVMVVMVVVVVVVMVVTSIALGCLPARFCSNCIKMDKELEVVLFSHLRNLILSIRGFVMWVFP